jgi:hypothetical protein
MTPDSKKRPTKKEAAKKTAVNAKEASAKKVTKQATSKRVAKKKAVKAKEAPAKKVAKKSTMSSKSQTSSINITSEERWKMIAITAYHKAEKRGFAPGNELQDWTEAEQEVDELLMSS